MLQYWFVLPALDISINCIQPIKLSELVFVVSFIFFFMNTPPYLGPNSCEAKGLDYIYYSLQIL